MKNLITIVKPHVVERLISALRKTSCANVGCITEVKGFGRQKNYLNEYQGSEYSMAYIPKIWIQVFVEDEHFDLVVSTIINVARTGRMGDGKIFVFDEDREV